MNIKKFTTEYRENPIGLDVTHPRFSWVLSSAKENLIQQAYQIIIETEGQEVWNTGRVESDQSVLVAYAGQDLQPETVYDITLEVWSNQGDASKIHASFETGLMHPDKMKASWIASGFPEEEEACPAFTKLFALQDQKVVKARLYATAHGLYEATINGQRVGQDYLTPGWTSYHNRLQYQTYDVTDLLNAGLQTSEEQSDTSRDQSQKPGQNQNRNQLQVTLADGWYCGPYSFMMNRNNYGTETALLAELHVTYQDGSQEIIKTDDTWTVGQGQIRFSQIYLGETIDSTFDGANVPSAQAQIRDEDKSNLVAQENEPVRITLRTPAREFILTPKGEQVLDFGQNMSGIVELHVKGQKGQVIKIHHAETLDKDGNFYPQTLRQATSIDTFICNGQDQILRPHFVFHGFRYIAVEGMELTADNVNLADFVACTLNSEMEATGTFACSDERLNQLWSNIGWGMRGNFVDIPTDCPQRDERLGWTGDAQIFAATASYLRNTALFYEKWLRDLKAEQTEEFGVPQTVPNILGDQAGCAAWSDAATIIPWVVYETFGDKQVLVDQYESMKGWVDYIKAHTGSNGLWQTGFQYGDWLALDKEESADRTGATDKYLVANAYYHKSATIVAKAAAVIGKQDDAEAYTALAGKIRHAFNEEYVTRTGRLVSETQTGCVLALYFDLAEDRHRDRIMQSLIQNIEAHKNHLSTGFVGTPYICHALSENGHHDLAGTIFMQEDYPSWLYAVKKGATTIWERWNSIQPDGSFDESGMNSLNHYAYGSIGEWMTKKILGINLVEPGYKKFRVAPQFVLGITRAEGTFESVYGTIRASWICENGKITVDVNVPVNTSAEILLPEREDVICVGSGSYHYEYETETKLEKDRFSMDSTLAQLLEEPLTRVLFDQYAPGALDGPLIQFAMNMSLAEMCAMAPDAKPLYEMILSQLNQK